jgi:site-specific DNA-methyltransferase (adenine-specific)
MKSLKRKKKTLKPNQIVEKDCLEFLHSMEDSSVDFTFSDPPYNVKKDYGIYKDNLSPAEYRTWMQKIIDECKRVSRRGVAFYVGSKLTKLYYDMLPDAHLIPVHKRAAGVFSGNYMLQYHSLFADSKPTKKVKDLWDDVRLPGEGYYFREKRYGHPGLTSELMTMKVLEHFTLEGETVFDPFGGVGTTAVACKKMKRNYLLTEINPKYIEIAYDRLEQAEPIDADSK